MFPLHANANALVKFFLRETQEHFSGRTLRCSLDCLRETEDVASHPRGFIFHTFHFHTLLQQDFLTISGLQLINILQLLFELFEFVCSEP